MSWNSVHNNFWISATGSSSANVAGIELSQSLVYKLAEGHLEDAYLKKCLASIEKLCKEFHLLIHMNFPPEHPVRKKFIFVTAHKKI